MKTINFAKYFFFFLSIATLFGCIALDKIVKCEVIQLGSKREIFVDNFLIDTFVGTGIVMHTPIDEGPVMYFDEPWEGNSQPYITILKDEDLYRAYYRGWTYK